MNPQAGARIAVVGVGAIGGALAADLADRGRHRLVLCARTPIDGLVVDHTEGCSTVAATVATDPVSARDAFGEPPAPDWILLATKAHQTPAARPWFDALCGPRTRIAILQNGVDHVERLQPLVPAGTDLVPVVIQLPATRREPGRIHQSHSGMLFVPDDADGRDFAALFEGGRTRVRSTSDFHSQAWWKLLSNAALGGVCALTLQPNRVAADPGLRGLVVALMEEIAAVGRAEGAKLPADAPDKVLARVLDAAPDHWSSITVDRREGRRMEWEVRNAVVGRLGRRHGIATPLNDAVTALLCAADRGLAESPGSSTARRPGS